jgi:prepilin-type N-terminal cleavage/methylation domain-containing protein
MIETPNNLSGNARRHARLGQRGMSLIELMIAMTVLAVGMLGCVVMILAGVQSNTRNKTDSTAVVLDQEILETFATYNNYPTQGFVTITDCALSTANANAHNASVVEGVGPTGAGATLYTTSTAPLPANVGDIDWTQPTPTLATSTVTGYAMRYQACNGDTYEVRWNIMQVNPNVNGVSPISLLTVSSRQTAAGAAHNATLFATPTTLRTLIEK